MSGISILQMPSHWIRMIRVWFQEYSLALGPRRLVVQ